MSEDRLPVCNCSGCRELHGLDGHPPVVLEGWVQLSWSTADGWHEKPSKWKRFKKWIRELRKKND